LDPVSSLAGIFHHLEPDSPEGRSLRAACARFGLSGMIYLHLAGERGAERKLALVQTFGRDFGRRLEREHPDGLRAILELGRRHVLPLDVRGEGILRSLDLAGAGLLAPLHGPDGQFASCLVVHEKAAAAMEDFACLHFFLMRYFETFQGRKRGREKKSAALSRRERECLYWCAQGKSYWETSVILGISERTVNHHMKMVRKKLGVLTNAQAVAEAPVEDYLLDWLWPQDAQGQ